MAPDDMVRAILTEYPTWAIVGASTHPARPAHYVSAFLQSKGYRVIPVNPLHEGEEIHGERCFGSLHEIPESEGVDVVDLFRRPQFVPAHVDEAIAVGAKAVWMQVGVVHDEAARTAEDAGLLVVMDRCPKIEIPTLLGSGFRMTRRSA